MRRKKVCIPVSVFLAPKVRTKENVKQILFSTCRIFLFFFSFFFCQTVCMPRFWDYSQSPVKLGYTLIRYREEGVSAKVFSTEKMQKGTFLFFFCW